MGLRTRIKVFLTPPKNLSREQERSFTLITIGGCAAIFLHASFALLFNWMRLNVLALQSFAAVFIWVIVIWLGRRGYINGAFWLMTAEITVFTVLSTYYIGWNSGVPYNIFAVGIIVYIFPFHRIYKAYTAASCMLIYILLYFFTDKVAWMGNPLVINLFWVSNVITNFGLVSLLVWYQTRLVATSEQAMDRAYALSETLLNNVMPSMIADRLKQSEAVIADNFPEASILFADIVNFTQLSQSMTPTELVQLLDGLFSRIDALVRQHKLEKIKTIGDAYMVAAGVPVRRSDHAEALVAFALDLQKNLIGYNAETGRNLQLRIGINSGPVVAGVIGKLRFLYDLWGDSVNTASRMESHGIPDEIQVTEDTRSLLLDKYAFEDRGVINIKGKGPMRTYLLRTREASSA